VSIALSYPLYETPWRWCSDCARAGTGGRCAQHLTRTITIPAITIPAVTIPAVTIPTETIIYPTEIIPRPREPWE
jgi:hypothetical protein